MIDPANLGVILLAAGRSLRFGARNKLEVDLAGQPLGLHGARAALALRPAHAVAICNRMEPELVEALAGLGFEILYNEAPEQGLAASLVLGVRHMAERPVEAALLCLADMPFIESGHLAAMARRFDEGTAPVVASSDGATVMPPALFARSLFPRLERLSGDQGARGLLAGAALVTAPAATLRDIDRPADLASQGASGFE